ncbi:uncharacterized protein Dvir_GJ11411 [Drosophila virilis]|uniref:Chitin-binding type-2 domain-containing protein n=1 Tax=Drosophila virilis TaxID=7244 RepID=B4LHU3_DROVI|nr:uncharacterized protein Dvir_GJ11411 [Drosophila virilis]
MKVTLLAVVTLTAVASLAGAADPECVYRKLRGLSPHWPNPSSCSSYYRCSTKNTVRSINCPTGKEYNSKTGKCSTAGRGLCKLSLAAPLADAANICADEVNGAYLLKTGYCKDFYICDQQLAYAQACDAGSYFDIQTNGCVPDPDAECWQNKCVDKENGEFLPSNTSCASYYVCRDQEATLQSCASGTYFDTTLLACVVDENNSQCWENFCIGKPDGSAVADEDDCTIFYMCSGQKATAQECPTGSYFDVSGPHCIPGTCPDKNSTTTTTLAPPSECDCADGSSHGELVPNPDNCRLYFKCLNGELVPGDCQRGNYFDPEIRVCVIDSNNCCPDSSTSDCVDGDVTDNAENCNQYYECENGNWQSKTCPSGSYFDIDLSTCVIDVDNVCPQCDTGSDSDSGSGSGSGSDSGSGSGSGSGNDTVIVTPSVPGRETPIVVGGECKDIKAAVAADNCWSYVACISGIWKKESCIGGFYFDASVGICRTDDNNLCPENKLLQPNSRSKRAADSDCTCPNGMAEGSMVAHPTDCDKYQLCHDGELIDGTCGQGNIFSNSEGACVPDTDATCWICRNRPNGYQMIDPADCTSYVTCSDGLAVPATCPTGEWFDGSACRIDVTGQCINPCSCGSGNVAHPICSKYYHCTDGVPQVVDCAVGEGFDSATGKCSSKVSCSANLCATADNNAAFPVADDDTKFYLCLDNVATIRSCPADAIFDPTLLICLAQPSSSCDQSVCTKNTLNQAYPSLTCDNSTFCLCESDGAYLQNCPSGYTFDETLEICTFTGPCDPLACQGKDEYSVSVNYDDPDSFCVCRVNQPIPVPCPIGYSFNGTLLLCVLAPQPDPRCCRNYCVGKTDGDTFPALNSETGFCYCLSEVPTFSECPPGKTYDDSLGICLDSAADNSCICNECDSTTCADNIIPNIVFPAKSTVDGFCTCKDFCAEYTLCPTGKEFDTELLICLETGPEVCDATQCDTLAENQPYEASNGTLGFCYCQGGIPNYSLCPDGFCLCIEGIAIFESCPVGKEYNATLELCLEPDTKTNLKMACDASQCNNLAELTTFAARDSVNGFCTCQAVGVATYQSCGEFHIFDQTFNVCVVDACDPALCRTRNKFDTFAARNTTKGFCSCDIVPTYYHCSAGHIFDVNTGVCVDEVTATVAACDPRDCLNRAQFEAFAAKNTSEGFCSCDGKAEVVTYHKCTDGKLFDRNLNMCLIKEHGIRKRSVEPEEKFVCEVNMKRSVPANCSQYEICLDGNWRRRTCSEARYYNPEQQLCLEPRDDMVCSYARVPGLPPCGPSTESETIPTTDDKGNCLQYFRCAAGKWRLRSCPRRHYYAAHLNTCLPMPEFEGEDFCGWFNRSETKVKVECQHLTVRPYPNGCDKFLMCMENSWWIQQCPLGMYFSRVANYCLPNDANQCRLNVSQVESTGCLHGQKRALATSCHLYEQCVNGRWIGKSCGQSDQFEPLLGCVANDGSCQGSGLRRSCQQGELRALPLPDINCTQFFYHCDADEWHLGSCLRGQSYARQLNKCQPLAKCQAQTTSSSSSSCVGQPDGQSVAHAEDCTRFYLCLQEQPALLQSCASGSFFDASLGYCRPNDGSCQQIESLCVNNTSGGLIAHAHNCRAYYNCSSHTPNANSSSSSGHNAVQLLYCPTGEYFNKQLAQCRPDQGQCLQKSLPDSLASLDLCKKTAHGTRLPHQLYCNQYYACVHGLAILAECESKMRFNATVGRCEPEPSSESDVRATQLCQRGKLDESGNNSALFSCDSLQDGSYVADYRNCTRYYICAGGVPLVQRCGAGAYFDAEQLLCTPDDGSCPYVITEGNQNATNTSLGSDHEPPNPVLCEGKHGHLLPDLANCNNFYICVSNKMRCERCYAGYFFNATLQQCQSFELTTDEELDGQAKNPELKTELMESKLADSQPAEKCSDAPTDFANLCEVIGEGASIAEPGDCRRYISCDEDEPISQRCRNGESYDSLLGICRQNDGTCLMENGERVGVCNGRHGQLARDTQNCRGYFVCLHGQKIEAECEAGQFFSKATSTCELDILQQCSNNSNELGKSKSEE